MRPSSTNPSERIAHARAGDTAARAELLALCRPRLLERIRFMLGDEIRAEAESGDFVQSVLLEALGSVEESIFSDERRLLRWMTAVARNNIRDRARRARVVAVESLADSTCAQLADRRDPDSPATRVAEGERVALLAELVEDLSLDERRVIELRELDGLTYGRIAQLMGGTDDRARLLHQRAILHLGSLCVQRGL